MIKIYLKYGYLSIIKTGSALHEPVQFRQNHELATASCVTDDFRNRNIFVQQEIIFAVA